MNLSKKTFTYSVIISGIIVTLMIAYFILMLPSLYVAHMKENNLESIKTIQQKYITEGNYTNVSSVNPAGTVTIKIPAAGSEIFLTNKLFSIKVMIKEKEVLEFIDKIRSYADDTEKIEKSDDLDIEFPTSIGDVFKNKVLSEDFPISFEFLQNNFLSMYKANSSKFYMVSDNMFVSEYGCTDGTNDYTNYVAFSKQNKDIVITLLTTMTPQITEIRPIVFQSLPMIIAAAVLILLISTMLFSRKIVQPIEKLVHHAVFIKENTNMEVEPVKIEGHDEIAVLGETLNELYHKLYENYNELEQKNNYLKEQNKRQEVFLRASSHQLKTPVAAAMLLVDGMVNEVGKYKDVKEHLPKVKLQLQSMRRVIDEILNLNNSIEEIKNENIIVSEIVEQSLLNQEVQIKTKELKVDKELNSTEIVADRKIIYKIIDNLISNATNYTPNQERIKITLTDKALTLINYGVQIEDEILPHIFEPFVSSSGNKGHGMGLYIVAYYAELSNMRVDICNVDNGVLCTLHLK